MLSVKILSCDFYAFCKLFVKILSVFLELELITMIPYCILKLWLKFGIQI